MTLADRAEVDDSVLVPAIPSRPYSRIRGSEPSVTTVLGMLPKPGLPWGAARETAVFAVLHPEKWQHLPENEAIEVLRKHHRGIWDGRAAAGSFVHGVNDGYGKGLSFTADDLATIVDNVIETERDARMWKERDRDELLEELFGYVLGAEQWWADFRPADVRTEVVVRWPGLYIGQTDLRCTIDGVDTLVDWKTTAKQDDGDGIYCDSWTLQLAMYGMARETVSYEIQEDRKLRAGHRVVESSTGEWSEPEQYMVVHLRGDEAYTAFDIPVTRSAQRTAVRLARAYAGWKAIPEKPVVVRKGRVA